MMFPKQGVYRSEKWKAAVREMGFCIRCGSTDSLECAHRDEGKGMGMKASDALTCLLCRACHYALGNGKDLDRDTKRAEMNRCIVMQLDWLTLNGRIKIA